MSFHLSMPLGRRLAAAFAAAVLCMCTAAQATQVVDFDDLDASALPGLTSYAGFDWTGFFAYPSTLVYDAYGLGVVSAPNAAATFSGFYDAGSGIYTPSTSTLQSVAHFDFLSAALGAAHLEGLQVTVQGVRDGSVVATQVVTLSTAGAQLVSFNFSDINELRFTAAANGTSDPFSCGLFNCQQVTLDNLSFASPVPEPAHAALLLGGLAVLAIRRQAA